MVLRRVIFNREVRIPTLLLLIAFPVSLAKGLSNGHSSTMTEAEQDRCFNFTVGNREKKEFYSPNYPNHYPNNTKCTLQLTADFGQVVQVDFRDQFHLEDSTTCEYDRLEVRDGPYGYSTSINSFCGHNFPPKITSSDRYLWLQFESDGSIEHSGFRAVYDFIPLPPHGNIRIFVDCNDKYVESVFADEMGSCVKLHEDNQRPPTEDCTYQRVGPAGIISKTDINTARYVYSEKWGVPIDCTWTITVLPGWKLYMNFMDYHLDSPNDCDRNHIEVYPENRLDRVRLAKFCGTSAEPQKTNHNVAHIRFFSDTKSFNSTSFQIHYTAFREIQKEEKCDALKEFDCGDQTCVDKSLKCDGQNDCKYQYDEDASNCVQASMTGMVLTSEHMIIILVVFFALVITMCASISISCYNKIKARQVIEKDYRDRRSKEASMDPNVERSVNIDHISEASLASQAAEIGAQRTRIMPTPNEPFPDDDDDDSFDGHVPEVDLSAFQRSRDGGGSLSNVLESRSVSRGGTQHDIQEPPYPYISESTDSLQSDILVAPPPPPIPKHLQKSRGIVPQAGYWPLMGRAIPPAKSDADQVKRSMATTPQQKNYGHWPPESRQGQIKNPVSSGFVSGLGSTKSSAVDSGGPRTEFLRGPLESGASRSVFSKSPGGFGLPRSGTARINPDGPRGPFAKLPDRSRPMATFRGPESYGDNPYNKHSRPNANRKPTNVPNVGNEITGPHQFRVQAMIESDLSRPDSGDSTQSAPDVVTQR